MSESFAPVSWSERVIHTLVEPWDHVVRRVASAILARLYKADQKLLKFGNYHLDGDLVSEESVVYSVGVGDNVHFDVALHSRKGCRIYAFDPSPLAQRTVACVRLPYLEFYPWGLWTHDETRNFYAHHPGSLHRQHLSTVNVMRRTEAITLECRALSSIMHELGHDRLDVLKMDIEGAAVPVLESLLEGPIRPAQIVFEMEKGRQSLIPFYQRAIRLVGRLKEEGYKLNFLPRSHFKRHNLEFLAVYTSSD